MIKISEKSTKKLKSVLFWFLLIFVILDLAYSSVQHYNLTILDGDVAESIVPARHFKPVFESPFGFKALREEVLYPNPNRFFSHWFFKEYLLNFPLLIQHLANPIDSVYLSAAIIKTLIQLGILFILTVAVSGHANCRKADFVLSAALIIPFFQAAGYRSYMGIIDPSITYTFFYALPLLFLLIWALPLFMQQYYHKKKLPLFLIFIVWIPLAVIVSLSGPLNPAVVLIVALIVFSRKIVLPLLAEQSLAKGKIKGLFKNVPSGYWLYLIPAALFSLYSLYLGKYNLHADLYPYSLGDLYLRLPEGVYYQFTQKPGFPVLFGVLVINVFLIRKYHYDDKGRKIINTLKWIGIFALIYILLLPLGGYRPYRPNILRYDTIMPITIMLIFIFAKSSLFLLKFIASERRKWYYPLLALVLFVFVWSDRGDLNANHCEKNALRKIASSSEKIVPIERDCLLLSWEKINEPEKSALNASLIKRWKITDDIRLYYNK